MEQNITEKLVWRKFITLANISSKTFDLFKKCIWNVVNAVSSHQIIEVL